MRTIRKIERSIPNLKQRKKVAAYARVSMESERMHHSLSAQVSYYSSLIQKNPDWEYAGIYADYGISGTGMKKRQEFLRMLEDAEAGKIDIILTKSIQRFARNTVDLLRTVWHLKELGIEVWFEKENIHTMSGDGELMMTILASFAQEESRSISENVRWRIKKQFEQGTPKAGSVSMDTAGKEISWWYSLRKRLLSGASSRISLMASPGLRPNGNVPPKASRPGMAAAGWIPTSRLS